jgi:hypothetical protein
MEVWENAKSSPKSQVSMGHPSNILTKQEVLAFLLALCAINIPFLHRLDQWQKLCREIPFFLQEKSADVLLGRGVLGVWALVFPPRSSWTEGLLFPVCVYMSKISCNVSSHNNPLWAWTPVQSWWTLIIPFKGKWETHRNHTLAHSWNLHSHIPHLLRKTPTPAQNWECFHPEEWWLAVGF